MQMARQPCNSFDSKRILAPHHILRFRNKRIRRIAYSLAAFHALLSHGLPLGVVHCSTELPAQLSLHPSFTCFRRGKRGFRLFRQVPASILRFKTDCNGIMVLGQSSEEISGKPDHEILLDETKEKSRSSAASSKAYGRTIGQRKPNKTHHRGERSTGRSDNAIKTLQLPVKTIYHRPDDIQKYMKIKRQLQIEEQKSLAAQAHAAAIARKEKMKALEMERKARLQLEALNGRGKTLTSHRPQWDSSSLAPTSEIMGPWLSMPDLKPAVDFPLPKPVPLDSDGCSLLCPGSNTSLESHQDLIEERENISGVLESSGTLPGMDMVEQQTPLEKKARGFQGACQLKRVSQHQYTKKNSNQSKAHANGNSISRRGSEEWNSKRRMPFNWRTTMQIPEEHSNCYPKCKNWSSMSSLKSGMMDVVLFSSSKVNPRLQCNKDQKDLAIALKQSRPPVRRTFHGKVHKVPTNPNDKEYSMQFNDMRKLGIHYPNEPKSQRFIGSDQRSNMPGKRHHKIPTRTRTFSVVGGNITHSLLYSRARGGNIDFADHTYNETKQDPAQHVIGVQHITYHLENFPNECTNDTILEKKRVALLKVLAQQLVSRLDAAQTLPSSVSALVPDENSQCFDHAFSIKCNLEKLLKKLDIIEKALEGFSHHLSGNGCAFIVLPSKLELNRSSSSKPTKQQRRFHELSRPRKAPVQGKEGLTKLAGFADSPLSDNTFQDAVSTVSALYESSLSAIEEHEECGIPWQIDPFQNQGSLDSRTKWLRIRRERQRTKSTSDLNQDFESGLHNKESIKNDDRSEERVQQQPYKWDQQLLDEELKRLDAEINETKSRMAQKLLLTHPPLMCKYSAPSVPYNFLEYDEQIPRPSHRMSSQGGLAGSLPSVGPADTSAKGLTSPTEEQSKWQCVSNDGAELLSNPEETFLKRKSFERGYTISTSEQNHEETWGQSHDEKEDGERKMEIKQPTRGETFINNSNSQHAFSLNPVSETLQDSETRVLQSPQCISGEPFMGENAIGFSIYPIEIEQHLKQENAGRFRHLLKNQIEENQELLTDFITDAVMEDLLEDELSDMVLHFQASLTLSECKRQKKKLQNDSLRSIDVDLGPAIRPWHPPKKSRPLHSKNFETLERPFMLFQDNSTMAGTQSLVTIDASDNVSASLPSYTDSMIPKCNTVEKKVDTSHSDSFKAISNKFLEKYVNGTLEAHGLLRLSNLLQWYVSEESIASVMQYSVDDHQLENGFYGRMLMDAVYECLEKQFSQNFLPSFLLFLEPCPEGPSLTKTLISKVNEHADAACEGGFSLECILEKSLDEDDWKSPKFEVTEVVAEIADAILMDVIYLFVQDLNKVTGSYTGLSCS